MSLPIRATKDAWGLKHKKGKKSVFYGVDYDIATDTIRSNFTKMNIPKKQMGIGNKNVDGLAPVPKRAGGVASENAFNQYSLRINRGRWKGEPAKYRKSFIRNVEDYAKKGGRQEVYRAISKIKKDEGDIKADGRDMKGDITKNPTGMEQKNKRIPIQTSEEYDYKEFYSTWGGKQGNTYASIRKLYGQSKPKTRSELKSREKAQRGIEEAKRMDKFTYSSRLSGFYQSGHRFQNIMDAIKTNEDKEKPQAYIMDKHHGYDDNAPYYNFGITPNKKAPQLIDAVDSKGAKQEDKKAPARRMFNPNKALKSADMPGATRARQMNPRGQAGGFTGRGN